MFLSALFLKEMTQKAVPAYEKPSEKQLAGLLIECVLDNRLTPREAINRWPVYNNGTDVSMEVALKILWYFEADELMHKTEPFYTDLQIALLIDVAKCFAADQPLPLYIINAYRVKKEPVYFYSQNTFVNSCLIEVQKIVVMWQNLLVQLCVCCSLNQSGASKSTKEVLKKL